MKRNTPPSIPTTAVKTGKFNRIKLDPVNVVSTPSMNWLFVNMDSYAFERGAAKRTAKKTIMTYTNHRTG